MVKLIRRVRWLVDREWVRVGWAGMPTLRHQLIAFAPLVAALPAVVLAERYSYAAGTIIITIGVLAYIALIGWIHFRRLAAIGSFSTTRSERSIKRSRRREIDASTQSLGVERKNGS